ncbi:MAG: hypothetical protein EOP04_24860 [Proteobacteria bacterium]|nr:MAG: hypothetical protein EOP04_24860 [Pseudomonadota bacterium]
MSEGYQFVDEAVTRRKFEKEWAQFEATKEHYRREGVLLLDKEYPNLYFAFAAPHLSPQAIVFAVRINFTNYDVWPPSVRFVDPLSLKEVLAPQLHSFLIRKLVVDGGAQQQRLAVWQSDNVPFVCFAGVREYHNHPRHKDHPWLMHRTGGEGRLCFLLDNLVRYGTSGVRGYFIQMQVGLEGALHNMNMSLQRIRLHIPEEHLPL